MTDRKTLVVHEEENKSILGKWYRYWVTLGGEPPYVEGKIAKENLCHFVRVLIFWAPLRWFFCAHAERTKAIAPWSIALAAIFDIGLLLFPQAILTMLVLLAKGVTGFAIGFVLVAIVVIIFSLLKESITLENIGFYIFSKLEDLGDWLKERALEPVFRFLARNIRKVMLLMLLAAIGIITRLWLIWPQATLFWLIISGGIVALILVGLGIAVFIAWIRKMMPHRADKEPRKPSVIGKAVGESFHLALAYASAKKAKICPYIEIQMV